MIRKLLTAAAAAALIALYVSPVATTAYAQDFYRPTQPVATLHQRPHIIRPNVRPGVIIEPRFVVEAVRIYARDETGWDRAGNDEVYVRYHNRNTGAVIYTGDFSNFDTGDTEAVPAGQSCIAPLGQLVNGTDGWPVSWSCDTAGAATLNFEVTLYERDDWHPGACAGAPGAPPTPHDCNSDVIGSFRHSLTAASLRTLMPQPGATRRYVGHAGGYDVTYRLRRVADVERPLVNTAR